MQNYERLLVLENIWKENSPIGFVAILRDFYSSSQKHKKIYLFFTSKHNRR